MHIPRRKFARKSIGAGLRFKILDRDEFTCRYCGSSAPHVVLNVDHVNPVALGGSNDEDNLVTACEQCNAGKSAMELTDRAEEFSIALFRLIHPYKKWSSADRSAAIVEVVKMAALGYNVEELMEVGRVSEDFFDVRGLCEWMREKAHS